jgi:hypothetical protein
VLRRAALGSLAAVAGVATGATQIGSAFPATWIVIGFAAMLVGLLQQTLP